MKEYTVIIEKDEDGFYVGEVVEIPGCYSQGETIEELIENIKEAIKASVEDMKENPFDKVIDFKLRRYVISLYFHPIKALMVFLGFIM